MTAEERRLFWAMVPVAVVIGLLIGLLPGDHIWVPVH